MEISKSTPYVRYRENISSSLHKGTVHIESEYLDRERKTSIESIEGQTWQNLVVNENKELEMLGVGSIGLSGDIYDTGEKRLAVDVVMGNATPTVNEDGTYTYSVSTMEGEYARTFDGVNHITSTSDGLDGEFHIKYNTQGEEIIGNFNMENKSSHAIENSKNGEITSAILKGNTETIIDKFEQGTINTWNGTSFPKPDSTTRIRLKNIIELKQDIIIGVNDKYELSVQTSDKNVYGWSSQISFTNNGAFIIAVRKKDGSEIVPSDILGADFNMNIPHFTSMQSVRMPVLTTNNSNLVMPSDFERGYIDESTGQNNLNGYQEFCRTIGFIDVKGFVGRIYGGAKYNGTIRSVRLFGYDKDKNLIKTSVNLIDVTSDIRYIRANIHTPQNPSDPTKLYDIYISSKNSYEPYKSNILTVNEPVELRGIGDVRDTLDLMTGEVIENTFEFTLDGSELWLTKWEEPFHIDGYVLFCTRIDGKVTVTDALCDKIKVINSLTIANEGIMLNQGDYNEVGLRVLTSTASTIEELKTWLSNNPIKILIPKNNNSVKTVALTIKDQDGKTSRQLSTYEGVTHVNVSSNGLTPSADISYKMYSTTDVVSGTSATIEDGKDSDMVEGVVYGNSMVNLLDKTQLKGSTHTLEDNIVTMNGNGANYTMEVTFPRIATQPNKVYTLCNCHLTDNTTSASSSGYDVMYRFVEYNGSSYKREKIVKASDSDKLIVTIGTETTDICISLFVRNANGEAKFTVPMLIEGDYTDQDIPYFDGIGSVENPLVVVGGKNLLDVDTISLDSSKWSSFSEAYANMNTPFMRLKPNTIYQMYGTITQKPNTYNLFKFHDKNGKEINGTYTTLNNNNNSSRDFTVNTRFTTPEDGVVYLTTYPAYGDLNNIKWLKEMLRQSTLMIEEGTIKTDYEKPTHAHLSTTPQITLHGIGDVKDELDLVNECVVRRIGTVTFNGSENWEVHNYGYKIDTKYLNLKHNTPSDTVATNFMCDRIPTSSINDLRDRGVDAIAPTNENDTKILVYVSSIGKDNLNGFKQWLSENPITVLYELATPTTESVLITPQNPKTSTASITIDEPLNTQDAIHDKLRWNPYKGCYVRYNHIVDGVAYNQHRTIENLYDLGERQYVDLYEHRTYFLPTNGSMESRTHGTSVYCLAEQGKQYCVRWDWIESPTVDTIKVDLCGNIKEVASTENSVVIDVVNMKHNFVQLQGNGLQGRFTNLMVIETVDGEIPDVDFFSGVKAIGNTVQIDGATKVQIDVEQTNGNLFDADLEIQSNGNVVRTINNALQSIRPNKKYVMKQHNLNLNKTNNTYLLTRDGEATRTLGLVPERAPEGLVFTTTYSEEKYRILINASNNGSANVHYPIELCYADMVKDGIRPRHHDMKSFILPMKLCRVGEVCDELYYDDLKGYYRIQQSIGHKYFTGDTSERWEMGAINLNSRTVAFTYKNGDINQLAMGDTICNGFKRLKDVNQDTEGFIIYNGDFVLRIDKERIEGNCSIDGLRAYLTSYPIHLFYQLKTPQMVDLPQYPNRLELNTYRDEVFTFIKDSNPTKFTLSVPMDRTYRFDDHQEGQGLANRVSITDERISSENVVAIQEIRGKGIANLIEDPNNVPVTPLPNYSGVATSHQLINTKPSIVHVHGFEPSGDTKIGTWNVADKKYQIKVMSGNSNYSLSDYYVLDVPYQLETYPDGTKDRVYYNVERQEWQVNGSYDRTIAFNASTGAFTEAVEIFRGMTPRSGMIAEFKLRFTSGTTTARLYYSVNGSTYSYVTLRGMVDDQDYYLAFFNTGGTKIDYSTKVGATTEYASMTALSATIPEGLFVNQIQSLTECTHYIDKFYQYPTLHTPIELNTFDGTTNIYIDGKTTDTNIIINNDCFQKVVNTYEDVEYTVYWKYLSGDGKLTITLGGTKVEVDGTKEYATIRTQLQAPQELVYIGGYNLSIQDVMVVKGARIDGLAYFEGSREVGTLVVDEHGNKQYKITLVQGGSVLEQKDYDKVEFKDDNKHNVVVHKIVGVRPTKVD